MLKQSYVYSLQPQYASSPKQVINIVLFSNASQLRSTFVISPIRDCHEKLRPIKELQTGWRTGLCNNMPSRALPGGNRIRSLPFAILSKFLNTSSSMTPPWNFSSRTARRGSFPSATGRGETGSCASSTTPSRPLLSGTSIWASHLTYTSSVLVNLFLIIYRDSN